jgi:chromosome segregation ATPase
MSQSELTELLAEKDDSITGLQREGESLSKQVGKHSEIIKKLRAKEKAAASEMKSIKTELEETKKECEKLQKLDERKKECERSQIEAIQNLTTANSKWESEHNKLMSESEDNAEKASGLSRSLEIAYKEVAELKRGLMEKEGEAQEMALSKEMSAKQALQEQLREVQEQGRKEQQALYRQIDDLRASQSSEERSSARREDHLLRERDDLLVRLEQSEKRNEDLSDSVSAATRPLLRQIASLQSSLNESQASSERVERSLNERLQQASIQLAAAVERERTAAEQYRQVSSRTAQLESKVTALGKQKSHLEADLECEVEKRTKSEAQASKASCVLDATKRSYGEEIVDLKRERDYAEASLESERAETASEKRKNLSLAEQLKERDRRTKEMQTELDLAKAAVRGGGFSTRGSSPVNSLGGGASMNGSFSEQWPVSGIFRPTFAHHILCSSS